MVGKQVVAEERVAGRYGRDTHTETVDDEGEGARRGRGRRGRRTALTSKREGARTAPSRPRRGHGIREAGSGHARGGTVRHEEELRVGTEETVVGSVRARKTTETDHVAEYVPRELEHADVERWSRSRATGEIETLPDGSVPIPLFEEQLVVTKRLVVRERIVIRKRTISEEHRVEADLRRERIEVDGDGVVVDGR